MLLGYAGWRGGARPAFRPCVLFAVVQLMSLLLLWLSYSPFATHAEAKDRGGSESGGFARVGVEEIVFACRQPGAGSHWYENFGYYAHDLNL